MEHKTKSTYCFGAMLNEAEPSRIKRINTHLDESARGLRQMGPELVHRRDRLPHVLKKESGKLVETTGGKDDVSGIRGASKTILRAS